MSQTPTAPALPGEQDGSDRSDRQDRADRQDRPSRRELAGLAAILLLAAATRLPDLAGRGRWNADQGAHMLAIHDLAANGVVPLLGPPASTGTFHHGALFYWLMAPAALVSGSDPLVVALWLTVIGLAAVAATWWLARLTAGPVAAVAAGVLAALSSSMIESSTFIWNPNPIALFAALAAAGTVLGHRTGRARWWILAGAGSMAVMQLHTLAAVFLVPVAGAWLVETIRARRAGRALRPYLLGGLGGALIVAAGFIPLLVHDLGHGFTETRALFDYVTGALGPGTGTGAAVEQASGAALAPPVRVLVVALRSLTWPLNGLFIDQPAVSVAVAGIVIALAVLAVRGARPWAARWQVAAYGWSVLALALAVPAMATVTPQLPNDHYHAFLDPLVLAVAGAGIARLWRGVPAGSASAGSAPGRATVRRAVAVGATALLAAASVTGWPPSPADDGGFPVADAAAARIMDRLDGRSPALVEIPSFKTAEGIEFPLVRRGVAIAPDLAAAQVVVVECDPLFDQVVGAVCGGEAERAWQSAAGIMSLRPLDRFQAGPRRWISIYENDMPAGEAP